MQAYHGLPDLHVDRRGAAMVFSKEEQTHNLTCSHFQNNYLATLINNNMSDIEYNDFGFTALDADELSAVDTKISSSTNEANAVIDKLDNFIRPLLENLAKDSDKDYIYWPNRVDIINKKILELDKIQAGL